MSRVPGSATDDGTECGLGSIPGWAALLLWQDAAFQSCQVRRCDDSLPSLSCPSGSARSRPSVVDL